MGVEDIISHWPRHEMPATAYGALREMQHYFNEAIGKTGNREVEGALVEADAHLRGLIKRVEATRKEREETAKPLNLGEVAAEIRPIRSEMEKVRGLLSTLVDVQLCALGKHDWEEQYEGERSVVYEICRRCGAQRG